MAYVEKEEQTNVKKNADNYSDFLTWFISVPKLVNWRLRTCIKIVTKSFQKEKKYDQIIRPPKFESNHAIFI